MKLRPSVVLLLASTLIGCAPTATAGSGSRTGAITVAEIQTSSATNAFDLVQSLRPGWLRVRGSARLRTQEVTIAARKETANVMTHSEIAAYQDGVRLREGTHGLRGIQASSIEKIEFLNAVDATARLGGEYPHGAIIVTTRS